jgi:hypothetical protein
VKPGICKLCLVEKDLCDSHLAPAGLYKYCAVAQLGPVKFTPKEIAVSTKEVTAYLLCEECEGLLNDEGERWLLPKLAHIDQTFPFYDILASGMPDTMEGGVAAFAASRNPEIAFRKLTNFAIGVFWKASVHPWRENTLVPLLELGKYREPFRLFLHERKPFPEKAILTLGVLPPDKAIIGFCMPSLRGSQPYHQYLFYIPGLMFILSVGHAITTEDKGICFFSNPLHPIILADISQDIIAMVNRVTNGPLQRRK